MFSSPLSLYFPQRKSNAKPVKDNKDARYGTFTPLLLQNIPFEGELLGKIPQLKLEDYEFNDQNQYP